MFHFRFPNEISKIEYDKNTLLDEITYAIKNLHGPRHVAHPPLMAFEVLVRKKIFELKDPIILCVDLVIEELRTAVRNCTEKVHHLHFTLVSQTNIDAFF